MYIDNDGNDGDGRDGIGGDSEGKPVAATATAATAMMPPPPLMAMMSMKMISVLRGRQLDNDGEATSMKWGWAARDMQNTCKCCAIHPKQQSTNVDSLGRRRQERGVIWGDKTSEKSQGGID
jgi:hypothetical protein